mgnify:CR=1 FL=1
MHGLYVQRVQVLRSDNRALHVVTEEPVLALYPLEERTLLSLQDLDQYLNLSLIHI